MSKEIEDRVIDFMKRCIAAEKAAGVVGHEAKGAYAVLLEGTCRRLGMSTEEMISLLRSIAVTRREIEEN